MLLCIEENNKMEADKLRAIVEQYMGVSIMIRTRRRREVEARMLFSKILKEDCNYSLSAIGRCLNKDHCSAIHYIKTINQLLKYDKVLYDKYVKIKSLFLEDESDEVINQDQLKYKIVFLEESLEEVMKHRNDLIDFKEKLHRIMPIINLVLERTPHGMEDKVERKMRTMFNGLDVSQIHNIDELTERE